MHDWEKVQGTYYCAGWIEYEWNGEATAAGCWKIWQASLL